MDDWLRELSSSLISDMDIDETEDGLIEFITLVLTLTSQYPKSTHATLHSQQDHRED